MTVEDNIAFPLREAGERDRKVLRAKVSEMLEVMEMEGQEDKMPESLSGGMKKRVGLARAIIRRPLCVLYDEPTAGLDPVVADSINRLIRRLQQRFGVTSVVVTHDMKSAFDVADRIAYLHEGRIYFDGTANQLQQSSDPLIQDFLLGRSNGRRLTSIACSLEDETRSREPSLTLRKSAARSTISIQDEPARARFGIQGGHFCFCRAGDVRRAARAIRPTG